MIKKIEILFKYIGKTHIHIKEGETHKTIDRMMALNVADVMTLTVNEGSVIPVTPEQVRAFSTWATTVYRNYGTYKESIYSPVIDEYMHNYILTPEMKAIWRASEPGGNVAATYDAPSANRLKIYRSRLKKKIRYMKEKLGKQAFRQEYREVMSQERESRMNAMRAHREQLEREQREENNNPYSNRGQLSYFLSLAALKTFTYKKQIKVVTEDFVNKDMDDACGICMEVHKMSDVCVTSCGHQFGSKCMSRWKKPSCPLCRSTCTEVTEYKKAEIK